ncbi:hypothetical protein ACP4OV_014896 [Aristida adscensionis]
MMKFLSAICLLLLVSGVHEVESRRHPERHRQHKLFVFGDSFVDAGNLPASQMGVMTRGWFYPYGSSDAGHDNRATGRLSDGMLQSDFLAQILGREESPPPYRVQRERDAVDASGVNFAMAGSGVYEIAQQVPTTTLANQIAQLRTLVDGGAITDRDLAESVALVAISDSRDYALMNDTDSSTKIMSFIESLTDEIVRSVDQLQKLGVGKVLVNSLPPIGCTPWRSWNNNYTSCDTTANMFANAHNTLLNQKLGDADNVLILDLYTMFTNVVGSGTSMSRQFKHKYTPCCDAASSDGYRGYCGQVDSMGRAQYSLCDKPDKYFYWDYTHPTEAGWKAVMDALEPSINDFLGIST